MKICSKCKIEKDLGEFYVRRSRRGGTVPCCKLCSSIKAKQRYVREKEHINKVNAKWKAENPGKHKVINAKWKGNNKGRIQETSKAFYIKNQEQLREKGRKWYERNSGKVIAKNARWKAAHPEQAKIIQLKTSRKIRSTLNGKLNGSMSSSIGFSLKGNKAGRRWESLVGYTVVDLKLHLERLFLPEMTWGNYGKVWEIDHKIPKSLFNYTKSEDIGFKQAWSLMNLQPLPVSVNRRKYNRIDVSLLPILLIQQEAVNG